MFDQTEHLIFGFTYQVSVSDADLLLMWNAVSTN